MSRAAFRVSERIYSEPDQRGRRQLLHGAGSVIPWDEARRLGLVGEGESVPAAQLQVQLPVDLYEPDDLTGGRRLVHRAGTVVTLAEAERLGLRVGDDGELEQPGAEEPDSGDGEDGEVGDGDQDTKKESEAVRQPPRRAGAGQPPRTAKQPAPPKE